MTDTANILERMELNDDTCFLCGKQCKEEMTKEHIFPKWLLRHHDLYNRELGLLNGTSIRYSQLTVPCCSSCNGGCLSALEKEIRTAFKDGYSSCVSLDPLRIYQWVGKIFFGILRKELKLLKERRDRSKGTIVSPKLIEHFETLHGFLQSIRQPFDFKSGFPFSILMFNLHAPEKPNDFFFTDSLEQQVLLLRSDEIGIIVSLQDGGVTQSTIGKYSTDIAGKKLFYAQFHEVYAKVLYQVCLLNHFPKFIISNSDDLVTVWKQPIQGLSDKPISSEWVQSDYVEIFIRVMKEVGCKLERSMIFEPPNKVMTWMNDNNGNLMFFDENFKKVE